MPYRNDPVFKALEIGKICAILFVGVMLAIVVKYSKDQDVQDVWKNQINACIRGNDLRDNVHSLWVSQRDSIQSAAVRSVDPELRKQFQKQLPEIQLRIQKTYLTSNVAQKKSPWLTDCAKAYPRP